MAPLLRSVAVTRALTRLTRAPPVPRALLAQAVRGNQQAAAQSHIFDEHDHLRRRLLYRSKQRGWL